MTQNKNMTIDDIARDLGVSKTTVSRAISGKGRISDGTRQKVMAYIEQCNYRPSAAAKGLAESKTYNLALVLPKSFIQSDLPHVRQSMNAICEEAFIWDYNILICLSTDEYPESMLRTLDNRKVDGVILSRTVEDDKLVDILWQRGIPFATIGSLPPHMKGRATVEADHDQLGGCYAFSRHFLRGDGSPVGLLGNDMSYIVNQSRYSGFLRAALEMDMSRSQIHLRTDLKDLHCCVNAVKELLAMGVRRFLAMDDAICLNVLTALQQEGLQIPQQVQLASLSDHEHLAQGSPAISALQFDSADLGKTACRELLRYLRGECYESTPVLGYRILARDSIL